MAYDRLPEGEAELVAYPDDALAPCLVLLCLPAKFLQSGDQEVLLGESASGLPAGPGGLVRRWGFPPRGMLLGRSG